MPGGSTMPVRNMSSMIGRDDSVRDFELSPTFSLDQDILESDVSRILNYDFDGAIMSESENQEGAFGEDSNILPRQRCHRRHTQHQIQTMEAFFKECPHPDDKQRKELSRQLGLKPLQIKFWFQNKRTQLKTQHGRDENTQLRVENENLLADNTRFKEALRKALCLGCGGSITIEKISLDEQQLMLENASLKEEIQRVSAIVAKHAGKYVANFPFRSPSSTLLRPSQVTGGSSGGHPGGNGRDVYGGGEVDKLIISEIAVAAMKELMEMAQMGEPLWFITMDGTTAMLHEDEYNRRFPQLIGPKPAIFKREVSRESGIIFMDHVDLVKTFMDVNQWSTMFSDIVSSATTLEVISAGVAGNYDGVLQVMTAEFQVPSPLAQNRKSNFVRYCKQYSEGTWAVVDVSLDKLCPIPSIRCRKQPTGCIIQKIPNGYSKVIWVEHVEVDDGSVHNLLKQLVSSGHAFGAKRWIATLERRCERLASTMTTDIPTLDVGVIDLNGRKNMLKLAERMVTSFFDGLSACNTHPWKTLSGTNNMKIVTRKSVNDAGSPSGLVLVAATTLWLPYLPKRIFEFLCDKNSRNEWDILSKDGIVQEMTHIANGQNNDNCVSVLNVNNVNPSIHVTMSMLQETMSDSMGSFLIYAPAELTTMSSVLVGLVDPDYIHILPSGYAILPDGTTAHGGGLGGSLLTVAYQLLVDSNPTTKLPLGFLAHANNLIDFTADRIKAALSREVA